MLVVDARCGHSNPKWLSGAVAESVWDDLAAEVDLDISYHL